MILGVSVAARMQWQHIFALFLFTSGATSFVNHDLQLSPILYITGYSGSRLSVEDSSDSHCNTNGEAINIWMNGTHISNVSDCFLRQIRMRYSNGVYMDAENVTISTTDFGKLSSLTDLTPLLPPNITIVYFVDYLVERGYIADRTIRAAPYDWRLGGEQLEERGYFADVRQLIEEMYEDSGSTKVTILAISMGGPVSHYFLTRIVTQEWKDKYIHSYIPIVGAWNGGNGFRQYLTPAPGIPFFGLYPVQTTSEEVRDILRTFPSSYFLLPHESVWKDTILVSTPSRNYTASDYQQLFADAGYPQGYIRSHAQYSDFVLPNVPTYCIYGLGIPTPETYMYDEGFPDTQPSTLFGDGDGVVNKQSLEVCARWANSSYPFNRTVFPGLTHFTITTDLTVLRSIGEVVGAPADPINVCQLPPDRGTCNAQETRYFFNTTKGTCEEFVYGGCDGNNNNFETLDDCNQECNPNGCPPLCTREFCSKKETRTSLCTLPPTGYQGECESDCRITYCHTCYYADEYRPLPGDCDTCTYYPDVRQAVNRCFKRWAVCVRRANGRLYTKARGRKQRTQERFKCYEHPCL